MKEAIEVRRWAPQPRWMLRWCCSPAGRGQHRAWVTRLEERGTCQTRKRRAEQSKPCISGAVRRVRVPVGGPPAPRSAEGGRSGGAFGASLATAVGNADDARNNCNIDGTCFNERMLNKVCVSASSYLLPVVGCVPPSTAPPPPCNCQSSMRALELLSEAANRPYRALAHLFGRKHALPPLGTRSLSTSTRTQMLSSNSNL